VRFSVPFHTGPGSPPSLLYNGYQVSFPGVKRTGRGVDHLPPYSVEVKERVELYLYSSPGPSWPVIGWTLRFAFTSVHPCQYPPMLRTHRRNTVIRRTSGRSLGTLNKSNDLSEKREVHWSDTYCFISLYLRLIV